MNVAEIFRNCHCIAQYAHISFQSDWRANIQNISPVLFCTSLFVRWASTDSIHFFRYDCHPFKLFVIPIMCIESVLVSFVSTILHIALALSSSLISWFFEIFWYGRRANDEVQATKMRREIVCGIFSKLNAYMITKHIFKYFGFGVFPFGRLVFLLLHSIQFKSDRKNNNKFSSILSLA